MQITTIILAGGLSKRMGTDKALLELDGRTLLERAIDLCEPFSSELLISSNHQSHTAFGYPVIEDEIKNCGPMGGIYSCLKHSSNDWNFLMSVDTPFIQNGFIEFLKKEIHNFEVVVPVHEGMKEPLIAFYHKSALPKIRTMIESGNYKLHFLLQKLNANFVESGEWLKKYPQLFQNLNYPDDI
ncbi:molybdenum cofactor guanylyltransferase [uncultured Draconibacterium sp.]|uniref:molybdenum cofactor guanylyltransferase n=1 Tax=uncultured Draconibacterium sp. TaxID=1573823 RepID=UPI0029C62163|nr:molybdenum cofactor guanylyltransferase [uncultured Draconibacterium sp.]